MIIQIAEISVGRIKIMPNLQQNQVIVKTKVVTYELTIFILGKFVI